MSSTEAVHPKNKLYVLLGLLTVFYALLLLYIVTTPLVELRGVVTGSVSLIYYHLTYYGSTIAIPSLDAVRAVSLLIVVESVFMLLAGVCAILCRRPRFAWELLFSADLVVVMYVLVPLILCRIVEAEVGNIAVSNTRYTSAGYMNFGTTVVVAYRIPSIKYIYIAATAIYEAVMVGTLAYLGRKRVGT